MAKTKSKKYQLWWYLGKHWHSNEWNQDLTEQVKSAQHLDKKRVSTFIILKREKDDGTQSFGEAYGNPKKDAPKDWNPMLIFRLFQKKD